MPNWIAKLIGKFAGSKLKLEDGPMEEKKSWWKSKTVWAGVVSVIVAGYNAAAANWNLPQIPEWAFALLGGLGVYSRVTATQKVG